jgi:hypothetical protein
MAMVKTKIILRSVNVVILLESKIPIPIAPMEIKTIAGLKSKRIMSGIIQ